ncbi:MAG: hypothetical protein ACRC2K_00345 [Clostridium sp.]
MSKVLVISKGTGQAKSFERVMVDHTTKNNIPVEWVFVVEGTYEEEVNKGDVDVAIVSPDMLLVQAKITAFLDEKKVPHVTIKPADFALKNVAKIMPILEPYIK